MKARLHRYIRVYIHICIYVYTCRYIHIYIRSNVVYTRRSCSRLRRHRETSRYVKSTPRPFNPTTILLFLRFEVKRSALKLLSPVEFSSPLKRVATRVCTILKKIAISGLRCPRIFNCYRVVFPGDDGGGVAEAKVESKEELQRTTSDVAGFTLEFLKGPRRGQKRLVDESPHPPPTFPPGV